MSLATSLRTFISEKLAGEPPFFLHLARDLLNRRTPKLFSAGPGTTITDPDVKEALIPFVSFARLYALRNGVAATNTQARLDGLRDGGVLKPQPHRDVTEAFDFLSELRHRTDASLAPSMGGRIRRASEQAQLLSKRISFDFMGSASSDESSYAVESSARSESHGTAPWRTRNTLRRPLQRPGRHNLIHLQPGTEDYQKG